MEKLKEVNKYAVDYMSMAIKEYNERRYLESCLYDFTFSESISNTEITMLDVAIGSCNIIITVGTEELTRTFLYEDFQELHEVWERHNKLFTDLFKNSIWSNALKFVVSNNNTTYITLDTYRVLKVIESLRTSIRDQQ